MALNDVFISQIRKKHIDILLGSKSLVVGITRSGELGRSSQTKLPRVPNFPRVERISTCSLLLKT